ncbi:hypothetical protein C8R45DRAFT_948358 [Mycena sanguinolenta]|nr:hypothetical protein C8R45DRAFT_948358 [Mycena sanguinolenta]
MRRELSYERENKMDSALNCLDYLYFDAKNETPVAPVAAGSTELGSRVTVTSSPSVHSANNPHPCCDEAPEPIFEVASGPDRIEFGSEANSGNNIQMHCKKIPVSLFSLSSANTENTFDLSDTAIAPPKLQNAVAVSFLIPQELEYDLLPSPYLSIAKMLEFPLPLQSSAIIGCQPTQFFSKELPDREMRRRRRLRMRRMTCRPLFLGEANARGFLRGVIRARFGRSTNFFHLSPVMLSEVREPESELIDELAVDIDVVIDAVSIEVSMGSAAASNDTPA